MGRCDAEGHQRRLIRLGQFVALLNNLEHLIHGLDDVVSGKDRNRGIRILVREDAASQPDRVERVPAHGLADKPVLGQAGQVLEHDLAHRLTRTDVNVLRRDQPVEALHRDLQERAWRPAVI